MSSKFIGAVLALGVLAACTTQQVQLTVLTGCRGWNQYEIELAPKLATMPADDYHTFSQVFARLTGGTPTLPNNTGLCRGAPPTAPDLLQRGVDEAMAQLQPLVVKYLK